MRRVTGDDTHTAQPIPAKSTSRIDRSVELAIAGGATTAYRCQVIGSELFVSRTTIQRSECDTIDAALQKLSSGEWTIVTGSAMAELRRLLAEQGVKA